MKFRMSEALRFWVDCEHDSRRDEPDGCAKSQLLGRILQEFEEAGDAMRYLNRNGEIAWKATPWMLERLADAEREAQADMQDWP